jgi:hypothetical protein
MKKSISLSSLSLLLLLYLAACDTIEKDEFGPEYVAPKTNTDQLVGEWEWIKTYNGWVGLETPASKGYTETLILDKTNNFMRSRNGAVAEEKYYYINKVRSLEHPQDSVLYIHLIDKHNTTAISAQPLYRISEDTIMSRFSEKCDDCPESYFVRKKATPNK